MRKKKLAALLVSAALIGVIALGGTLAYFTDKDEAKNVIMLGKVDGELEEPQWKIDNPDGEIENVKPGDKIVKDPILTLADDSEDAYARFKVTYSGNLSPEQFKELKFLKITGTDAGKEKTEEVDITADEYFYVQDILSAGESYKLFDYVVIPTSWGNDMAEASFNIDIVAELIQADNFTPVEESGLITGWGDVTIEKLNS